MNSAEWDLPHPRRAGPGIRAVRLGWFTSQPAGLLTLVTDFGNGRFDLLVVPPDATRESAEAALDAAVDVTDNRRTPDLLTDIEYA